MSRITKRHSIFIGEGIIVLYDLFNLDKYNSHFGEIHFTIWTNTFYNLYKTKQSIFIRGEHKLPLCLLQFGFPFLVLTKTMQCNVVFPRHPCGLATSCGAASECHNSYITSKSNWNPNQHLFHSVSKLFCKKSITFSQMGSTRHSLENE